MSATKSSLLKTIRQKCLDCTLDQNREVQLCPAEGCPLWKYRLGKDPEKKPRQMSEAQRAVLDVARRKAAESRITKNI